MSMILSLLLLLRWICIINLISWMVLICNANTFVDLPPGAVLRGSTVAFPYDVAHSANIAKEKLQSSFFRNTSELRKERLAVMILFGYPLIANGSHPRMGSLVCALNKVFTNISPKTPTDIYVWFNATTIPLIPNWFSRTFPEVIIMPIDPLSWLTPTGIAPFQQWTCNEVFSLNYHLMGRWRLTFALDFPRAMGYQYMLQMDDDTFAVTPVTFNIVQDFRERRIAFALRDRIIKELDFVLQGLPELVQYWMVTRNYLTPQGTLFDHFSTPSVSGISGEGWDRHIVTGSFLIFDVGFWFEPTVQDLLHLAFSTGGDLMQRWQEQGLQNMIYLLFLPDKHVHRFPVSTAVHAKVKDAAVLRMLQCDRVQAGPGQVLALDGVAAPTPPLLADLHEIEFLVLWQVDAPGKEAEELTLFRWRYNTTSCGVDTPVLNNYAQYEDTPHRIEEMLHIDPDKWYAYEMDAKLSVLQDTSRINVAQQDGVGEGAGCKEVLRQQLRDFVEFYCIGYGTDRHEQVLNQMCNALLQQALGHFERQAARVVQWGQIMQAGPDRPDSDLQPTVFKLGIRRVSTGGGPIQHARLSRLQMNLYVRLD